MGVSILGVSNERSKVQRPPREENSSCSHLALGLRQPRMPTSNSTSMTGLHS
jgi:hypothetical protein